MKRWKSLYLPPTLRLWRKSQMHMRYAKKPERPMKRG